MAKRKKASTPVKHLNKNKHTNASPLMNHGSGSSRTANKEVSQVVAPLDAAEELISIHNHNLQAAIDKSNETVVDIDGTVEAIGNSNGTVAGVEKSNGTVPEDGLAGNSTETVEPPKGDSAAQAKGNSTWAGAFKATLTAKGASLGFVAPSLVDGKLVAPLDPIEVAKGSAKWSFSLIFYVVGQTPTFSAVTRYVTEQWNFVSKPEIFLHDDGYFIIKFVSEEDKNAVLRSGPHMFWNRPTIVKPWTTGFDFHSEVLKTVPLWVRFVNLPLNCWSVDCLSRIGSLVGVPLCADECTTKQLRVSFARILVEVDVTKELPKSVYIQDGEGKVVEQVVKFEWAPKFCEKCQKVGHKCGEKKVEARPAKVKKVWVPKSTEEKLTEPEPVIDSVPAVPDQVTPAPAPALGGGVQEDGWQPATRPVKERRLPISLLPIPKSNSYMSLIEEVNEELEDLDPVCVADSVGGLDGSGEGSGGYT